MDMTPGRAIYSPDEELKPLRTPKIFRPETQTQQQPSVRSSLSPSAHVFVPRRVHNNVQERLQRHQRPFMPYQQQQQYNQQPYANGYSHQQPQQQLMNQMNSLNISNVQDRLKRPNDSVGGSGSGGDGGGNSTYYNQRGTHEYQQNQAYHPNNKYHHNNNNHQHSHQQQSNQGASSSVGATDPANDVQTIALNYLTRVIQCLNQNPGQFDSIASRFITIFDGMENNHYVLSIAMEDIFDVSIKNPNFRYMGAKLYNLLHMLNPSKDSLFHTFLKRKLDFHQEEINSYIQSNQQGRVRETALFLAELYMQLRGDDSRIYLIAENIVYSLKKLLQHVVAENVRCICLTLKLAGYDLSIDCPEDMKEIIASLDAINVANPGKYPLASNVISLQKTNWGRKSSAVDTLGDPETSKPPETPRYSDDPVFYGPDGHEITAEECAFLTGETSGSGNSSTEDEEETDVEDLEHLDPEMDNEAARDYKRFIRETIEMAEEENKFFESIHPPTTYRN